MDWIQFTIFAGGVFGIFFWSRSESREDIRHLDEMLASNRALLHEMHKESTEWRIAMLNESKDFHGRLERQDAEFKSHLLHCHSMGDKK